jgi:hypothetical protein
VEADGDLRFFRGAEEAKAGGGEATKAKRVHGGQCWKWKSDLQPAKPFAYLIEHASAHLFVDFLDDGSGLAGAACRSLGRAGGRKAPGNDFAILSHVSRLTRSWGGTDDELEAA